MENDYKISFFKPTTKQALINRNLTIILVTIWVIAIFGFHILLKVVETPTPEKAYTEFESVWPKISNSSASQSDKQVFEKAVLSVLGKLFVKNEDRAVLNSALSSVAAELLPANEKQSILDEIQAFEKTKKEVTDLRDPNYIEAKQSIINKVAPHLGLQKHSVEAKILPASLFASKITGIDAQAKKAIPQVMAKYLIHNQSFLTDFKFLGFPFHYFYTAVFLLILFIALCWVYCVRIQSVNKKLGIENS